MPKSTTTYPRLKAGQKFIRAFQNALDQTLPSQLMQAFIAVADHEGRTLTEIAEELGANLSTTSRHILDLSQRNRKMEEGYKVVESRSDAVDLRLKRYYLTPKGHLLARSLQDTLES